MVAKSSVTFRERYVEKSKRAVTILGDEAPAVALERMERDLREFDEITSVAGLPSAGTGSLVARRSGVAPGGRRASPQAP